MNKRLPFYNRSVDLKNLSREEYLELRKKTIGGSDVGSICGLNEYRSAYEFFGKMIGEYSPVDVDSQSKFFGRYFEKDILNLYQYWEEGDLAATDKNIATRNKIRKLINPKAIVYHKEFDFMHCTPDGLIRDKTLRPDLGLVEIKTINGFAADKYIGGLPPSYLLQLQYSLAVTGLNWGIFLVVVNGNEFKTYYFERDEVIIAEVINTVKEFWENVQTAKKLLAEGNGHLINYPDVDASENLSKYLANKFTAENEVTIEGNEDDINMGLKYSENQFKIKELEKDNNLIGNTIKAKMQEAGVMTLGKQGSFTWKRSARGTRTFKLNIK